ncbi:MAG TPA: FecR domain-containing protein [Steroidobacteraceae bacterium]|nr:FecR domain-containing protein [Steroidobacteraceae bacterium]
MITEKIEQEAAHYFLELHKANARSQSFIEWQRWMNADPAHRSAYEGIEQTMMRLKIPVKPPLPCAEELAADGYDGSMSIEGWRSLPRSGRRRPFVRFATAASLAALSLAAAGFWLDRHLPGNFGAFAFRTRPGERREIVLPEGSHVTLDADSVLNVELTPGLRSLELTRGEAYFKVSKNPARPFVVRAANGRVRAVGTAFDVHMSADRTVVAVTDGKVEVTSNANVTGNEIPAAAPLHASPQPHPVQTSLAAQVSAGQAVSYEDDGGLQELPAADASLAISWLNGRRQYRDEPLRYVLADIDRYTGKHIDIVDDSTGDLEFTGTLDLNDSAAWIKGLSVALPVKIVEDQAGQLSIEAR